MGVSNFYRDWVASRIPKARVPGVYSRSLDSHAAHIETLMFDLNGLFHKCAERVFAYGRTFNPEDRAEVERLFAEGHEVELWGRLCQEITTALERETRKIISRVNSRFNTVKNLVICVDGVAVFAKITQQRTRRFGRLNFGESLAKNDYTPPPSGWNSAAITPGTPFMVMLDSEIRNWLRTDAALHLATERIVYSSFNDFGEGEHKMFQLGRDGVVKFGEDPNGVTIIYGLDADLIILSGLSFIPRVYLCREQTDYFVAIDEIRNGIAEMMESSNAEQAMRDFSCLMTLVGNDFSHRLIAFHDLASTLDALLQSYVTVVIKGREPSLLNELGQIEFVTLHKVLQGVLALEVPAITELLLRSKLGDFNRIAAFDEPKVSSTVDGRQYWVNSLFRNAWYAKLLGTSKVTEQHIEQLCVEYITGLQFVSHYYINGFKTITATFAYQWTQAPLLADIVTTLKSMIERDVTPLVIDLSYTAEEPRLSMNQQLVAVMPLRCQNLVPKAYHSLRSAWGELYDLFPTLYEVDFQGREEHNGIARLPHLSRRRLRRAVLESPDETSQLLVINHPSRSAKSAPPRNNSHHCGSGTPRLTTNHVSGQRGLNLRGRGAARDSNSPRGQSGPVMRGSRGLRRNADTIGNNVILY